MARLFIPALAIALVIVSPANAGSAKNKLRQVASPSVMQKVLPVFEFMGSNTEDISTMSQINQSKCSKSGTKTSCTDYDPTVAGRPMRFLTQDFYGGKLYRVYASFGEYAYSALLAAVTAKYGQPTRLENRKWQSKGGSVFDNTVAIWAFKGGSLELDSMGLSVDTGSFEFNSTTNAPPPTSPTVDF